MMMTTTTRWLHIHNTHTPKACRYGSNSDIRPVFTSCVWQFINCWSADALRRMSKYLNIDGTLSPIGQHLVDRRQSTNRRTPYKTKHSGSQSTSAFQLRQVLHLWSYGVMDATDVSSSRKLWDRYNSGLWSRVVKFGARNIGVEEKWRPSTKAFWRFRTT